MTSLGHSEHETGTGHDPGARCPFREAGHCPVRFLLSGHTIQQLPTGAQLLVWALRRQRLDGEASPALAAGFRLALGLAAVEPALAAFEALAYALTRAAVAPPAICCLRCPFLSADEWSVVALVEAADETSPRALEIAQTLVRPTASLGTVGAARELGHALRRAGLMLGASAGTTAPATRRTH